MKFQPDFLDGVNTIGRFDGAKLVVGTQTFDRSVVVPWAGAIVPWTAADFETLRQVDFDALLALRPEIVLFGSGSRLRFPSPALLRELIARRVGVESMDTAAACRTYNVLAAEGRNVVAALLIP
ncbi:MAG: Xcc1710-like domain-containing protein [Ideonella sp.]|nr:Xcc1710-like domain-containing protein [Ideonella sp.]